MSKIGNGNIKELTRTLRRNQTESESMLWEELRNRKLCGLKFLRQHPIYSFYNSKRRYLFIADFYCAEKKLVVELDGEIHIKTREYDEGRDAAMMDRGLRILRIENKELSDIERVLEKIKNYI